MSDSIFNDTGATTPNSTPAGTTPTGNAELGTLLASIKNPQGEQKYKTVEEALKALGHSQSFIPELQHKLSESETRSQEAAQKLQELDALKDTVAKLTQRLTDLPETPPGKGMSEADIAEIVGRQLTAKQEAERAKQNTQHVTAALSKQFGDKAAEVFYGKAQELGMSQEQINSLAASAPQAVLTMFGVSGGVAHKQTVTPPSGTVNTTGFTGTNAKSFIGRETNIKALGATMQDTLNNVHNAKMMVEELAQHGMSVHDLTDPKTFFKYMS